MDETISPFSSKRPFVVGRTNTHPIMSFTSTLNITDKQILDACRVIKLVGEKTKEQSEKALLEEDYTVNVEINYTFSGKRKNTPVKIVLKKSLFSTEDGDSALLIVSNTAEKVKDLLKEEPINGVSKVVTLDKLRSTFVRYEQKRDLLKNYERILADEAIVPMIPSVLGKTCMKAKKHPVPVKLDWEMDKLKKNIEKGLNTTLLFVNCAPMTSVRAGKLSFTDEELLENIRCVLATAFKYIDSDRISSISLKVFLRLHTHI